MSLYSAIPSRRRSPNYMLQLLRNPYIVSQDDRLHMSVIVLGLITEDLSPDSPCNMSDKEEQGIPSYYKGEFSFVNKDASNIRNKSHKAAVSWHVMNKYERFKKQEKAKQAKRSRASAKVPSRPLSSPFGSTLLAVGRRDPRQEEKARLIEFHRLAL